MDWNNGMMMNNGMGQPGPYNGMPGYMQPPLMNYQERLNQMQAQLNQRYGQQNAASIKMVESFDVVKATDIPMDGAYHYFSKADRSEIYAKKWMENGTIDYKVFRQVKEEPKQEQQQATQQQEPGRDEKLQETLEGIAEKLKEIDAKLEKQVPVSASKTNSKKEDAAK